MSFSDEYTKLRKKRKEEEKASAQTKTTQTKSSSSSGSKSRGGSFSDEYTRLRAARKEKEAKEAEQEAARREERLAPFSAFRDTIVAPIKDTASKTKSGLTTRLDDWWDNNKEGFLDQFGKAVEESKAETKAKKQAEEQAKRQESARAAYSARKKEEQTVEGKVKKWVDDNIKSNPLVSMVDSTIKGGVEKADDFLGITDTANAVGEFYEDEVAPFVKKTGATLADISEDALTGFLGVGEGIVDFAAGEVLPFFGNEDFDESMADFVEKDLYNENEVAKQLLAAVPSAYEYAKDMPSRLIKSVFSGENWLDKEIEALAKSAESTIENKDWLDNEMEDESWASERVDELAQSGGQLAAAMVASVLTRSQIVGKWVMSASSGGQELENALRQGATLDEARISALTTAAAEYVTEGIGSIFGNKLTSKFLGRLTSKINSKALKFLFNFTADTGIEALEEVLSRDLSTVGQKLTYRDDESWSDLFLSEEAWKERGEAAIGGAALGSVFGAFNNTASVIQGKDPITGLKDTEKQVVDAIYEERIAEAEKKGELSKKDKSKIYDEVLEDLENGDIRAEDIERLFGGETYTQFSETLDKENATREELQKEYDALEEEYETLSNMTLAEMTAKQSDRRTEIKQQMDDLKAKIEAAKGDSVELTGLRQQLESEVFGTVKDSRLAQSFFDREQRRKALDVDLSEYDGKTKEILESIMAKGQVNNTRRARDFWTFAARVGAETGLNVTSTTTEEIIEMETKKHGAEYAKQLFKGKTPNAYILDDGTLAINVKSAESRRFLLGHEVTHTLEKVKGYEGLRDLLYSYAETKMGKEAFEARKQEVAEKYKSVKEANADAELVADLVGEYLYDADENFIRHLSTKNSNVFKRVWDELKYLVKIATAGSQEARDLARIERKFAQIYKETGGKAQRGTANGEAKFSISPESDKSYSDAVQRGDMGVAQSMVDHQATIAGYTTKLHHGTAGEPFYVFRQGAEGIHFGTLSQATQRAEVSESRYGFRSEKYASSDVRRNIDTYPDTARRLIVQEIAYRSDVELSPSDRELAGEIAYSNESVPDETLLHFLEVADEQGKSTYSLDNHSMKKSTNKRVITAYVKANAPLVFDIDIGSWTPFNLADLFEKKINGQIASFWDSKTVDYVEYDPQKLNIELTEADLPAIERLKQSDDFGDAAAFLQSKGFDSIRYRNTYEGTQNEESYILLSPEQVKSADPVTYDDDGNVIPLSQRFDSGNADIRYSLSDIDGNPIDSDRVSPNEYDTRYSISHNSEIAKGQSDFIIAHKSYVSPAELEEAQRVTAAIVDVMMKYSSILPEDKIGKVLTKNGSYDRSVENTTICVRTLAYNEFVDKVQEELGRPLTQMESFLVSQKMYDIATDPQCLYCYVSLDRKAFNDMLLRYMQDRDTIIAKYNASDKTDAAIEELYNEFLNGRKPTKEMRSRFDSWISYVDSGTQLLSLADIATEERQSTIKSGGGILAEQLADARKYAQSASWSKIQKDYVAYRDEILKLGDKVVKNLNEHYGMRWYSFSEYSAAFIVENMQQITDASIRGLKGLSYTKETDYAEIFAPSGMNINISVFVNTDADGNFFIDEKQSANFEKALELRERYPNVGIVATVTNDDALRWAAEQEWSDIVIPFHIVRTGTNVAEYYKWLNYTAESADTVGDKDMWNAYLDSLNLKSDAARKRVSKNIYPSEHMNDKGTYLALCESRGLTPRFARFAGEDWYMKLVNETRLSANESSPLKPVYNLDAAKASFAKFVEKGGYEGGWYRDGVDVDAEARAVADDVRAGKKANEVDYGRQDGFMPEELIAGRKTNRQHGKYSLSEKGKPTIPYSRNSGPMYETMLEGLPTQSIAPVATETTSGVAPIVAREEETEATEELFPDDYLPIAEDEANRQAAENLESISDADAPIEVEPQYGERTDAITIAAKPLKQLSKGISDSLGLNRAARAELEQVMQEFSRNEYATRADLFGEIQRRFGTQYASVRNDEIAGAKEFIRGTKIFVSPMVKSEFGASKDYASFMRSNLGKIKFSKDGAGVDQVYLELTELYPGLFPTDIINPADQLQRIAEVANTPADELMPTRIDDDVLFDATDMIYDSIAEYRETERMGAVAEMQGIANEHIEDFAPVMDVETEAAHSVVPVVGEAAAETITPPPEKQPRMARATPEEQARASVLVDEPTAEKKKMGAVKWAKEHIFSHGAVFEDLSLKTGNRELMARWDSIRRARGIAQNLIGEGNESVKSLDSIREAVEKTGKTEKFYEYLYHMHNADRMSLEARYEGAKNKPVFGSSVTSEMSQKAARKLGKENPEFGQLAQDVYDYVEYLREVLVEGGVISRETANLWAEMYPHYVPIRRAGDVGRNIDVPLDTKKTGVNAPIKRAKGGSSDILPLFGTLGDRTIQTFTAIAKNRFGVELKNTLGTTIESDALSLDDAIDSIDEQDGLLQEGKDGQNPTFTVFEDGKKVTFEITDEMYEAMRPSQFTYTNKALNKIGNARRDILTTYSPTFMATNPIKDIGDIIVNSQHPVRTYAAIPSAIKEILTKGKYYRERMAHGGEQDTYFDGQTKSFKKPKSKLSRIVGFPFEKIRQANEIIEQVPRMAEYIASRKMGRSIDVSMLDAARVTTNFGASGDFTNMLNRNGFTFLGASVEGFNQQVRNIREAKAEGLKGWLKLAAKYSLAGLPAMLLNAALWDDDEEYEDLSDYVKENYYIVAKYGDGEFVRIPKGRAVAVIQNAFEQMSNLITGDDEVDLQSFFDLALTNLAPNSPLDNNLIAPITQVLRNETWYGEDLVPTRLQDLPAEEQYDESTDAISRWLGEKIGASPYKINYLLDQYSGGVGDMILPYLTPEADGGGLGAAFRDKFTTDSVLKNQNVSDFYDKVDELNVNANGSSATDEDILKSMYMSGASSKIGELYQQKREIQSSTDPAEDDAYKHSQVRTIQDEINRIAEDALNNYDNVSIKDNYATVGDVHFRWYEPSEDSQAEAGWRKISDDDLEKQEKVTSSLGISASDYWGNKEEYDYAYKYPAKYAVSKSVGGYEKWRSYSSDLYDIKADKDENGKSISGSRKEKVIEYVNNLDADYGEKIILFKSEYNADDTYNYEIIDYLNSREDISYEEMETILKELGFEVSSDGTVKW